MESQFTLEKTTCPLCHGSETNTVFTGRDRLCKKEGEFQVVQCKVCGLMYTNPRPTQETMGYFYPPGYAPYQAFYVPHVEMFQKTESLLSKIKNELKYQVLQYYYGYHGLESASRFSYFARLPVGIKSVLVYLSYIYFRKQYYRIPVWEKGGRALDLGCGSGAYLLLLKNIGWEVIGVDIGNNAAEEVKEASIPVLIGQLKSLPLERGSFHVITLWHVLEHLHYPLQTLQELSHLLTDNGSLFIEVPNSASIVTKVFRSNWFAWDLPRHLYHFSPMSLSRLLKKAGFKELKIRYLSKNTVGKSMAYWLENKGIAAVSDQLDKNTWFNYFLKFCGALLASLRTSDTIFIVAQKH